MKALLLSCGTGGGHNAAAQAIAEELLRRGDTVTILNPYDLCSDRVAKCIDRAYILLAQRIPRAFGALYTLGNLYSRLRWRSPLYFANGRAAGAMDAYLRANPVDVIIMTHLFPAQILTYMRSHGMSVPKTILVSTDYTCIPFFKECKCDYYVTPSPKLTAEFTKRGVAEEQIMPLGIPVGGACLDSLTREEARKELKLRMDCRYLLVAGGSIGAGKMEKTIAILSSLIKGTNWNLIIVCGNNKRLLRKLEAKHYAQSRLIGHTSQMPLYLRACDAFFSKPGGLSITEAAVMEVPLVLLPPIPGCESRNFRFFVREGLCLPAEVSVKGLQHTLRLLDTYPVCEQMFQRQKDTIVKDAASRIVDLAAFGRQ